jgi:N-acetylmuramoyl-L-alanine amidase
MRRKIGTTLSIVFWTAGMVAAQDSAVTATAYQTVNVRSGPDTRFEIVGQLQQGDTVDVTGRESEANRWLEVTLPDGQTGWVASFAVIVDGSLAGLPVVGETPVDSGAGDSVTITAYGRVNVRSGPSMAYDIVGQLDVEDEATATARNNENNDWLLIENEEIEGWVAYFTVSVRGDPDTLPVLIPAGNGEALLPQSMVTTTRFNVRLHTEPSRSSPTVTVVPFNSNVTLLARTEDGVWLYVLYGDIPGWGAARLFDISREQLEMTPLYTPDIELKAEPPSEATPEARTEGG